MNPKCSSSADLEVCESHGTYYPKQSNTSSFVGGEFDIKYGTGAVRGQYWSDLMGIASKSLRKEGAG